MRYFRSLIAMCVAVANAAISAPVESALAPELLSISIDKITETQANFVFEVSSVTPYHFFTMERPARAVIDFAQVKPYQTLLNLPLEETPVAAVRTGFQADGTTRYVFDLKSASAASVQALQPHSEQNYRIIVTIERPDQLASNTDNHVSRSVIEGSTSPQHERPAPPADTQGTDTDTLTPSSTDSPAGEWSGYASLDARLFPDSPAYSGQRDQNASVALRPEYYREWDNGGQQFSFIPFGRLDSSDSKRTHADIRELYWRMQQSNWAIKAGIDVVFWGVAESQHLVDIINQTDLVENIDGEDKLGQPMLNLDYLTSWGTWQAYLMPYFRERTYAGKHGRLRTDPPVDVNNPIYDSNDEEYHLDFALRWTQYIGDFDIGLGYFSGTIRNPLLIPSDAGGKPTLTPYYVQIDQTSLDMQATVGAWLWKLEAIYNQNKVDDYYAYVGGFEYTQFGIAGTAMDLGWLLEYNHDQRGKRSLTVLQDDIYFGMRLAGNDIASSSLLAGLMVDTDNRSTFINVEASRRISEQWTLALETRFFVNIDRNDAFYYLKSDDYVGIELSRFF